MLDINKIVKLTLQVGYAAVTASAYDAGLLLTKTSTISTETRLKSYDSLDAVNADTALTTAEKTAAALYFGQSPAPARLFIGAVGDSESALVAYQACVAKSGGFWGVALLGDLVTDSNASAIATAMETANRGMLFYSTTAEVSTLTADDGILATLQNADNRRCMVLAGEAATDAVAVMGAVAGLNRAHTNDAFSLCYKTISGINTRDFTQTEVDSIEDLNGSVYVVRGYSHKLLEKAATGSGLRVDEVLYLDRMQSDIQDACYELIAGNTAKLPQNDSTSALFVNAITSILQGYTDRGVIGAGIWQGDAIGSVQTGDTLPDGYVVYCDSYVRQSTADRAAHKAMPITVGVCLTGAVESIEITIHAQR